MPRRSSPLRMLVAGPVIALIAASVGLSATPASADSVNSIPPNKVSVSLIRCTGSTALVKLGTYTWPNPDTWKAYACTTRKTSADGSTTTRMDYWKAAKTYVAFNQCYIGWTRYIYAPQTTWTKRYWTQTRKANGGVSVTGGHSGWY